MDRKDFKIVFFGTPEFAVESLDLLVKEGYDVAAVVTMPDKIAGRGHKLLQSDVKKYALEHNLKVLQPPRLKAPEFLDELRGIGADLFVVIAFRMLPKEVWSMPRCGTFNLHAALLPKFRGAAPINHAIITGETETGVTTFFIDENIDTGEIIDRRSIPLLPEDNAGTLHDKLMHIGAEMTLKTVGEIAASPSGKVPTRPQPEGEFTPAPKIFKQDCHIDWSLPAEKVHNLVRGLSPYPAAWGTIHDASGKSFDIKIYSTRVADEKGAPGDTLPGTVKHEGKRMYAACADRWIEILELMPAGKRRMDAAAFLLGYKPEKID